MSMDMNTGEIILLAFMLFVAYNAYKINHSDDECDSKRKL